MKKGGKRGENMSELNRLTEQLFRHMVGRGTDRRGADDYDYFTAVQYSKESRPENSVHMLTSEIGGPLILS